MSVRSSSNRYLVDSLTVLRPAGLAQVTASTSSAALPLDILSAYWMAGDVAEAAYFAVEVGVESFGGTATTPSATFAVVVAQDSAFTINPVTLATATISAPGRASLVLDRSQIVAALNGELSGYMEVTCAPAASTNVAWNSYLAPIEP